MFRFNKPSSCVNIFLEQSSCAFSWINKRHDNIFILAINQLDARNLFYNKFISCLYMFRAHVLETCRGMK